MSSFLQLSVVFLAIILMVESATIITQEEFNSAATKNGFRAPPREYYDYFVEGASKYSREEQAMFLAQLIHESQGFYHLEEQECLNKNSNKCDKYKPYWGRGFIHLTWKSNYEAASKALGLGDKLVREPGIVAKDKRLAMLVSVWYWDVNVRPRLRGKENHFGVTTFVINSGECRFSRLHPVAESRWKKYLKVAEALGITNKAKETGCYN